MLVRYFLVLIILANIVLLGEKLSNKNIKLYQGALATAVKSLNRNGKTSAAKVEVIVFMSRSLYELPRHLAF